MNRDEREIQYWERMRKAESSEEFSCIKLKKAKHKQPTFLQRLDALEKDNEETKEMVKLFRGAFIELCEKMEKLEKGTNNA